MVGQVLTLSALVALSQAKAIVSNNCHYDVHLSSVPNVQGFADSLTLGPGEYYEEPWRPGTSVNPGIAIKLSSPPNGINESKSEIDFQYTLDHDKVWIDLSALQGSAPRSNVTFFTCHGPYNSPNVPTRQCSVTDDIELAICSNTRIGPAEDITSPEVIKDCSNPRVARDGQMKTHRRPRQCNPRVVGPKRTSTQYKAVVDKAKKEADPNTPLKKIKSVPLKTVLQSRSHWADKVPGCFRNQTIPGHEAELIKNLYNFIYHECTSGTPIEGVHAEECAGVIKYLYKSAGHECTSDTPIQGVSAEEYAAVIKDTKAFYPDIDKPVVALPLSHQSHKTKVYIGKIFQKLISHVDADKVKQFLGKINNDYDFTTEEEVAHHHTNKKSALASAVPGKVNATANVDTRKPQPAILLAGMCHKFLPDPRDCGEVQELLTKQEGNHGLRFIIEKTYDANDKRSHKPTVYVGNVCKTFVPHVRCSKLEHHLKKEYHDYYHFTDDESTSTNHTALPKYQPSISINSLCRKFMPKVNCEDVGKSFAYWNPAFLFLFYRFYIPHNDTKVYLGHTCDKFTPSTRCNKLERYLQRRYPGLSFSNNRSNTHGGIVPWSKSSIAIDGLCKEFMPTVNCSSVQEDLEYWNPSFNFTT
ncbi:hypothetical protein K504DRAFT_537919 [Pleomassaria siparia CBS 279.74]|uniref:Peptidase S33 tripeptidyl aminopeptidase-like C-terminal domain-containing protein n=1 Tax=Pleomassaria siparia CBS 279.74 TaxID=1314801 RepID=A0A6G1JVY4_9PLEO|nr:hypothetical protein K504DRAFT_537919 [Pleomassaria siparia CBS 279.74]